MTKLVSVPLRLDLDQMEFNATDGIPNFVGDAEVLALIKVARAAVAWRGFTQGDPARNGGELELRIALREAGL